jgi:hypothetical protein
MDKLEQLLDNYDNYKISKGKLKDFERFGYDDYLLFNHHLKFLLENCYDIDVTENIKQRLNQTEFRNELLKKFNSCCLITGEDCEIELAACHIIPVKDEESYDIDNGLLLRSNLHNTFDKYLWSINPETLIIESRTNIKVGNISQYVGQKIKLSLTPDLKTNLGKHYQIFLETK